MDFKTYIESDWGDFFNNKSTIVKREPPQVKPVTLELYRGCHPDSVKNGIISPERSEQGMLWFTHKLITGYNPIQYAATHGDLLLTYPLTCKKHFELIHWSDGFVAEDVPVAIRDKSESTENCRFYAGYELPEGWVFTYKHEKFIGCTHKLRITPDMIRKSEEFIDNY